MTTDRARVEPPRVVMLVENYVDRELDDAARFENRSPFDASGVWSLHAVAAEIYALGWQDSEHTSNDRHARQNAREHGARSGAEAQAHDRVVQALLPDIKAALGPEVSESDALAMTEGMATDVVKAVRGGTDG